MPPKLVIFDCDGVLVDSEPISNRVLRDNLETYGLSLTIEDCVDRFVGGSMAGVGQTVRDLGYPLPETWLDEVYDLMYAALAKEVEEIPNIVDVLDALTAAGIPFCVASNGSHEKMQITLGRTGLLDRFEGKMFSAHDLPFGKPDPRLFLTAADRFGTDPSACLVIEDSATGAKGAQNAKMQCFGFIRETPKAKLAPLCDQLFDDMAKLPAMILGD